MIRCCIIVPVYNHPGCLDWLVNHLEKIGLYTLLVNDGSDEVCSQLMRDLAANHEHTSLIEREKNGGKGAAVKSGLRKANRLGFTHAVQVDADGQHDLGDIPVLLEKSAENPEALISGEPIFEDIPKLRYYGRYATHVWVWINTWSLDIRDSMCGFRVYPVEATCRVINSSNIGDRMDFDTEILVNLHWEGIPVIQVPTSVSYPKDGVSHFRGLRDNLLISWAHTRMFFGMLKRVPRLLHRKLRTHG